MLLLRLFFFILHVISLLGNADKGAKNLPAFPIATISKRKRLNNVIRSESRKKIKKISQLTLSPAKPFFEHPIQSKTDGRVDHNKSDESNTGIMIECQHGDGCQKQATFGMFGRNMQPKPMFCLKHALHDNFFLKRGWCRWFSPFSNPPRHTSPSHYNYLLKRGWRNFLVATTPQPYTSHIASFVLPGLSTLNLYRHAEGCNRSPTHGSSSLIPMFCTRHKYQLLVQFCINS